MTTNQFISVRETAQMLSVSEKKVMDLIEERKLQAYRIANKFLRLKKGDVVTLLNTGVVQSEHKPHPYTSAERVKDFFYFNDFHLLSLGIIALLIYFIFNA